MNELNYFKENENKIRNTIKKDFQNAGSILEDLVQEGLIAFYSALIKMDKSKSKNIFTYCYQKAKWKCIDILRKSNRQKCFEVSNHPMDYDDNSDNLYEFEEVIIDDIGSRLSQLDLLEKALNGLPNNHRQLLLLEFYGIKPSEDFKRLSSNSICRIKRNYLQEFLKLSAG